MLYLHLRRFYMTKKVMISIDEDVLDDFDEIKGLVPRSTYIADLMRKEVARVGYGKRSE